MPKREPLVGAGYGISPTVWYLAQLTPTSGIPRPRTQIPGGFVGPGGCHGGLPCIHLVTPLGGTPLKSTMNHQPPWCSEQDVFILFYNRPPTPPPPLPLSTTHTYAHSRTPCEKSASVCANEMFVFEAVACPRRKTSNMRRPLRITHARLVSQPHPPSEPEACDHIFTGGYFVLQHVVVYQVCVLANIGLFGYHRGYA